MSVTALHQTGLPFRDDVPVIAVCGSNSLPKISFLNYLCIDPTLKPLPGILDGVSSILPVSYVCDPAATSITEPETHFPAKLRDVLGRAYDSLMRFLGTTKRAPDAVVNAAKNARSAFNIEPEQRRSRAYIEISSPSVSSPVAYLEIGNRVFRAVGRFAQFVDLFFCQDEAKRAIVHTRSNYVPDPVCVGHRPTREKLHNISVLIEVSYAVCEVLVQDPNIRAEHADVIEHFQPLRHVAQFNDFPAVFMPASHSGSAFVIPDRAFVAVDCPGVTFFDSQTSYMHHELLRRVTFQRANSTILVSSSEQVTTSGLGGYYFRTLQAMNIDVPAHAFTHEPRLFLLIEDDGDKKRRVHAASAPRMFSRLRPENVTSTALNAGLCAELLYQILYHTPADVLREQVIALNELALAMFKTLVCAWLCSCDTHEAAEHYECLKDVIHNLIPDYTFPSEKLSSRGRYKRLLECLFEDDKKKKTQTNATKEEDQKVHASKVNVLTAVFDYIALHFPGLSGTGGAHQKLQCNKKVSRLRLCVREVLITLIRSALEPPRYPPLPPSVPVTVLTLPGVKSFHEFHVRRILFPSLGADFGTVRAPDTAIATFAPSTRFKEMLDDIVERDMFTRTLSCYPFNSPVEDFTTPHLLYKVHDYFVPIVNHLSLPESPIKPPKRTKQPNHEVLLEFSSLPEMETWLANFFAVYASQLTSYFLIEMTTVLAHKLFPLVVAAMRAYHPHNFDPATTPTAIFWDLCDLYTDHILPRSIDFVSIVTRTFHDSATNRDIELKGTRVKLYQEFAPYVTRLSRRAFVPSQCESVGSVYIGIVDEWLNDVINRVRE